VATALILRVMARENRDMRLTSREEGRRAAAQAHCADIIFFLPVLFVVILGPAIIQMFGYQ
jgi:tight adherence protein C